ncbi:MAG: FeoB-associated Cys-rich membrane protein [Lachnospiraceae bacterium]|nr:FeoB-associated Cys-rich membrane protein [Lachnospiraceae bacterium]
MSSILTTAVVTVVIAAIVIFDIRYIIKKKKEGACIGCPASGGKCTCHCNDKK